MTFPSAIITNSITNALHATVLLVYFLLTLYLYIKGKRSTSEDGAKIKSFFLVAFFFALFVDKMLGVLVHYLVNQISDSSILMLWKVICVVTFLLNYFVLYSMEMPNKIRRCGMFISLIFSLA